MCSMQREEKWMLRFNIYMNPIWWSNFHDNQVILPPVVLNIKLFELEPQKYNSTSLPNN